MKTVFISDLHLSQHTPSLNKIFFQFLETECSDANCLYILGDLFEAWIGDDNTEPFVEEVIKALNNRAQSTKIFIMHGNRDFLLGNQFAKRCGATLISDPTVIDLYGIKTILTHGDLLCTKDKNYQRFRKLVRCKLLQRLYLSMPLSWRKWIAQKLRSESQSYVKTLSPSFMDATTSEILKMMDKYNVIQLIHGHTHQPSIHTLFHHQKTLIRYVLSDWHANKPNGLIVLQNQAPYLMPSN